MSNKKYIAVLGCFDTKGLDFSYLINCVKATGQRVITINTGVMDTKVDFQIDYDNEMVVSAAGSSIRDIREAGDRGKAVNMMGKGASEILSVLVSENCINGVIGMGGGGGTYIALSAMQKVPFGIPKLCLSTVATKDLSRQVGVKDIVLMPSVVDIAGLNSISRLLIEQAVAAVCGMAEVTKKASDANKKRIAISMFGNTTKCVDKCTELLKKEGYEVMAFHATGVGGSTMESLVREKFFEAVLDITTTELADDLCGGICDAGPNRLTAASEMGVPQVVVPGCLDMVNFAQVETVPDKYQARLLYSWAPDVTLLRTNEEENEMLGRSIAAKLNTSTAAVIVIIPKKGISQLDSAGGVFYKPNIDTILFKAIKSNLADDIPFLELDAHINDPAFADALVKNLLELIR